MENPSLAVVDLWLREELEEALRFVGRRLRGEIPIPGLRGFLADILVDRARKLGLKKIDYLLENAGDSRSPDGWRDYAELQEVYRRARRDHPRFPDLEDLLRTAYLRASGVVARLLKARGGTMGELLRSAYPTRQEALEAVQRELEMLDRLLDLVGKNLGLVAFPGPVRGPWLRLARETADFSRGRLVAFVEEAYAR
ncbi:MAG: hypothetical protein QXO51_03800 [Halobacteria archaeon]